MASHHEVSLLKWGKPDLVTDSLFGKRGQGSLPECGVTTDPVLLDIMRHSCKEAALSQLDKEQILNAIRPPREWVEDGKRFRQVLSKEPARRSDVLALTELLNELLALRQARPDGICPVRRELADECFDEIIRQVTLNQAERGLLLLRVRDELKMTLAAYQDLFVSARDHDPLATVATETVSASEDLSVKHAEAHAVYEKTERERSDLQRALENNEQIYREERESAEKRHHEEFQFLKRVNNTLKQQIDLMLDPDNDSDPVISEYVSVSVKEPPGPWKSYARSCVDDIQE